LLGEIAYNIWATIQIRKGKTFVERALIVRKVSPAMTYFITAGPIAFIITWLAKREQKHSQGYKYDDGKKNKL